jgi:2-aminoethylphosphonate-pyruvate transaminase
MHFTPPVQTIYAARQGLKEYFAEGETAKWRRHQAVWQALVDGAEALGFELLIDKKYQSKLVVSLKYPNDTHFSFDQMHDLVYKKDYTIYPGKVSDLPTFRLCALGAITPEDIQQFYVVLKEALIQMNVQIPVQY